MRKGWLSVVVMLLMAVPLLAQNARVQFVHNAADIDARRVDVWVGDSLWVDDMAFRTATAFQDVAAGTLSVTIAPNNQMPADSVVAQKDVVLDAGSSYVIVINGITPMNLQKYVNPDTANRDITITPYVIGNAKETADDSTKVEAAVFHGATDLLAVDILVDGGNPPFVDDLDYGASTAYMPIDPGMRTFDVTASDDNANVIGSFEADLSGMAGKSAVIFVSGFADPANNEGGQKLGLFAVFGDGQVMEFTDVTTGPVGVWQFMGESDYMFDGIFLPDTVVSSGHGIAVDKYGRIWVGSFYTSIVVYNPDGTQAPFSPIDSAAVDTLNLKTTAVRGMGTATDGNILAVIRHKYLVKFNADDGTAMAIWEGPGSLTKPAVDSTGFIYLGKVVGVSPVNVVNPNTFQLEQQIDLPGAPGFTRGIEVSPDGKRIWSGDLGESGGPVKQWYSEDLLTYNLEDSIFTNTDGKLVFETQRVTMDWDPMGRMWVSVDNSYDVSDNSRNALVVLDFDNKQYTKVMMPDLGEGVGNGPRGVAFSASGDTAYVVSWNASMVYRYVRKTVGIGDDQVVSIPETYRLGQNYPNPFNPTTVIPFEMREKGHVTIKIFDTLGREVRTLVDQKMPAGKHLVEFNARNLPSGVYYYRLSVNGKVMTKKMVLSK